jgi:hypothetical protein
MASMSLLGVPCNLPYKCSNPSPPVASAACGWCSCAAVSQAAASILRFLHAKCSHVCNAVTARITLMLVSANVVPQACPTLAKMSNAQAAVAAACDCLVVLAGYA